MSSCPLVPLVWAAATGRPSFTCFRTNSSSGRNRYQPIPPALPIPTSRCGDSSLFSFCLSSKVVGVAGYNAGGWERFQADRAKEGGLADRRTS